ncbi:hypothetical protein BGX24_010078 [Mortierella sp. AD032]|nr:hypothetical protein BGX24_010078 [Mortierella sp. AD032]
MAGPKPEPKLKPQLKPKPRKGKVTKKTAVPSKSISNTPTPHPVAPPVRPINGQEYQDTTYSKQHPECLRNFYEHRLARASALVRDSHAARTVRKRKGSVPRIVEILEDNSLTDNSDKEISDDENSNLAPTCSASNIDRFAQTVQVKSLNE